MRVVELACVDVDFGFVSLANVDNVGEVVNGTDAEGYTGMLCSDVQFLKHIVRHCKAQWCTTIETDKE